MGKTFRNFFGFPIDVFICGSYIWCEDSPINNVFNVELFELLEQDIVYFSDKGSVYVIGAMNGKTGLRHDFILQDCLIRILMIVTMFPICRWFWPPEI